MALWCGYGWCAVDRAVPRAPYGAQENLATYPSFTPAIGVLGGQPTPRRLFGGVVAVRLDRGPLIGRGHG
ncbi:hypothetical protein STRIP9103_02016 [Streptomyces ipomoeae 91-03]|uniref:Uncharacterized protein n=1 Tax=Streptomyces ipomoeae 91-03 TaxID=698759 RepID=L1KN89_9ACTN|nr:hypothetical protein STRIP9103_02016 [Streptomyces ipomoeae 91-03]